MPHAARCAIIKNKITHLSLTQDLSTSIMCKAKISISLTSNISFHEVNCNLCSIYNFIASAILYLDLPIPELHTGELRVTYSPCSSDTSIKRSKIKTICIYVKVKHNRAIQRKTKYAIPRDHIPDHSWHPDRRLFIVVMQKVPNSFHSIGFPLEVKFIPNLE